MEKQETLFEHEYINVVENLLKIKRFVFVLSSME